MNKFRFDAMVDEFPFILEILGNIKSRTDVKECSGITISRLDKDALNYVPNCKSWDGSLVGIDDVETIHFVLDDGAIVMSAVKPDTESGSNYAHSGTYTSEGESVLEAIYRGKYADSLKYVVKFEQGYNIVEHYSTSDWRLTIYKLPKGFTLAEAIEEAKTTAKNEVAVEVKF